MKFCAKHDLQRIADNVQQYAEPHYRQNTHRRQYDKSKTQY